MSTVFLPLLLFAAPTRAPIYTAEPGFVCLHQKKPLHYLHNLLHKGTQLSVAYAMVYDEAFGLSLVDNNSALLEDLLPS
jgi:hypothetical protein